MKVSFLGAAAVAQTLGTLLVHSGHEIVLSNSRGPESLTSEVQQLGPKASAATVAEAASLPVVVLAVPWTKVEEVLSPLPDWNGRILIDATNIFTSYVPTFKVADLGENTGSEIVAGLAKGARVVKCFNTLPIEQFFRPAPKGMKRVAFLAGDDSDAKRVVAGLVESIGLASSDVGPLRAGGKLMELRGSLYNKRLLREP